MTEEEFIKQAKLDWEEDNIETLEDALEACYMNGSYDDIGGDVESPTGHFFLVERWILITDSNGSKFVHRFETTEEAENRMEELQREYDEWWIENE